MDSHVLLDGTTEATDRTIATVGVEVNRLQAVDKRP
jgi:hypothetical protein